MITNKDAFSTKIPDDLFKPAPPVFDYSGCTCHTAGQHPLTTNTFHGLPVLVSDNVQKTSSGRAFIDVKVENPLKMDTTLTIDMINDMMKVIEGQGFYYE